MYFLSQSNKWNNSIRPWPLPSKTFPFHRSSFCNSTLYNPGTCRTVELPIELTCKTPWPESASKLYRPSVRRLSAKWLPIFADRRCHLVSVTNPYGLILGFLDRSRYFSIKQLLSFTHEAERTPFQTHYLFSGSAGNRTRASGSVAKNSDH
jgi:hypothetical protein